MKNKLFVLDTNVLVSAFIIKKSISRIAFNKAAESGKVAVSEETLAEFKEVLFRPKFDKYLPTENKIAVFNSFKELSVLTEIIVSITDCRDPKDNKFLELAVSADASCLITGDKDLLTFHPFRGIPILNPVDFVNSL